ncbi:multidrug ABC transporter ATP-binding protein [Capsulimonas corticalis]|uniref:Multidrug ABC transporter ATP-binding protein n=1 Tax=Capsulimonas corticalis TaxID=2219043 RepID=A0A402CRD6_9BACT|nr:ABC transporter ATP-binding protein [Capsulimonas corticalis]BDI34517.1 multidrug ABC transporter ATP-binding protein [Capsulimonas corticalis]
MTQDIGAFDTRRTLRRVIGLFSSYRPQIWLTVAGVTCSAALGLLPPLFLKVIVNQGILPRNMSVVTRYSAYTILAVLAGMGVTMLYNYVSIQVGQKIMRDLRRKLFAHLQAMPLRFFTETRTGEIQSRISSDVGGVQGVVSDTATTVLSHTAIVLSTVGAMLALDWRLTLFSMGTLPLFALIAAKVGRIGRTIKRDAQEQTALLTAATQEMLSVSGILLTKTTGRQGLTLEKFDRENDALTTLLIKQSLLTRYFYDRIGVILSLTPILVYWMAGYLMIGHGAREISLGGIVAFTALQSRLFFPLAALLNIQVQLTSTLALFDRIFEYLDLKPEIADAPEIANGAAQPIVGAVEFDGVTFRYKAGQEKPTLADVSFSAQPGQLIALVGHSGAGKSTMTYLLARLYDVSSGAVRIDGADVRNIPLASLGASIGFVTQETFLLHDTIRENLRFGDPDATDEQIAEAAKAAAIHDHILTLPDRYETIVGERGYKLSGGEKQRIAIARAILKNPRILVLDEATSELDTHSEQAIHAALTPLMRGRTTIAIAHRLSTILAADQILVMDSGRIVERGTHDTLLAAGGRYAKLFAAQYENGAAAAR